VTHYASTTRADFASTNLNAGNNMKINSVLKHLHAHLKSANTGTLKYAETIMERENVDSEKVVLTNMRKNLTKILKVKKSWINTQRK
jgi:predicted protein tyrosine phosphatase